MRNGDLFAWVGRGELRSVAGVGYRDGVPAREALRAATAANAAFLGVQERIGAVRPGYEADLLLVRGDPTEDLAALHDIVAVWADGRRVLSLR